MVPWSRPQGSRRPAGRRLLSLSLAALWLLPAGALAASPAPLPAPAPVTWGCQPGHLPNPCDGRLDTTFLRSTTLERRRIDRIETPPKDADRSIDCFYVYPTVNDKARTTARAALGPQEQAILKYQAARFSQVCDVYAPLYRQATLWGWLPGLAEARAHPGSAAFERARRPFDLGYADVLAAWKDYLANHNRGRGVVLIGHSQGSGILERLLREVIDPDPAQRARIVSAILPGGNVFVPPGERVGGDFQHVPLCAEPGETGCVVAWSTFAATPAASSLFGRTTGQAARLRAVLGMPVLPGMETACTSPSELAGDGNRLQAITRSEQFPGAIGAALKLMFYGLQPTARTTWVVPGERYVGRCVRTQGAHVLLIKGATPLSVTPFAAPWSDSGLHLADINFALGNLLTMVRRQRDTWVAQHPAAN